MRRTELMTAAGATLAGLGVLVGVAIGSGSSGPKAVAQRLPPVEVRTQVIRKTVNVYRKAKPHHTATAGAAPAAQAPGDARRGRPGQLGAHPRERLGHRPEHGRPGRQHPHQRRPPLAGQLRRPGRENPHQRGRLGRVGLLPQSLHPLQRRWRRRRRARGRTR